MSQTAVIDTSFQAEFSIHQSLPLSHCYNESLLSSSSPDIPTERFEYSVSSLPARAHNGEGDNSMLSQGSPSSFLHDSSLANAALWTELLTGVYCPLHTVTRSITCYTELENDQTMYKNAQASGCISGQDAFNISVLSANYTIPDFGSNQLINPAMATTSSHSLALKTQLHQASVSLSNPHYPHFTLDLEESGLHSGSTTSGSSVIGSSASFGGKHFYAASYRFLSISYRIRTRRYDPFTIPLPG